MKKDHVSLKAYGKINLGLDITGIRDDGYHLLKMVMQTVDVCDDITVSAVPEGIVIKTDLSYVPDDERNLAYKAAQLLKNKYGIKEGVSIKIKKNIPVGGGMAGGSADAAAVIKAMDELFSLNMNRKLMDEIALKLGADVPFCLRKGTWIAEGIGEKLTPLPAAPGMSVLIYAPDFGVSTQWAYKAFDGEREPYHPKMDELIEAIRGNDIDGLIASMGNSLEPVVEKKYPRISTIRRILRDSGAERAMMSGSGSVVFGLFKEPGQAKRAYTVLSETEKKSRIILTGFIKGE